ncbi:cAMP-dependent protein kinase catalytic subunit beta-like isoform X2 [Convolutriloba macropyga]|uniref:cAMP-dependent protein kinase catalytic subunit beta-like isoform X2 n=1 Tax=Convolutriloba macropyga TaxID=536237 RepID=UPI003F52532B
MGGEMGVEGRSPSPGDNRKGKRSQQSSVSSAFSGRKDAKTLSRSESNRIFQKYLKKAKAEFETKWEKNPRNSSRISHFDIRRTLGTGSFGRVMLAKYKPSRSDKYYAIKVLDKQKVVKLKQIDHTIMEKKILACIRFPFIVRQAFAFKDNSYLYIALEFVTGGEMFTHLRRSKKFSEHRTCFYGCQVLMAFEYLHYLNLIHRDLKPENLLIDHHGYVKLTDFGFCKRISGRTWTMCGTPEYLAPEIILSKGYGFGIDWWSFGVLLYEMAAGKPPFEAPKHMQMYELIVAGKYKFPPEFSSELKDLIKNLLQVDVTRRYGVLKNGSLDIKNHKFFDKIDYVAIYQRKVTPPYLPKTKHSGDDSNFAKYDEPPLSVSKECLFEREFRDF